MRGNQVPRGIGRRVTKRTTIKQMANLRSKRIDVDGQKIKIKICTSCLKRMKKSAAALAA
jgi:ribosomal protein L28